MTFARNLLQVSHIQLGTIFHSIVVTIRKLFAPIDIPIISLTGAKSLIVLVLAKVFGLLLVLFIFLFCFFIYHVFWFRNAMFIHLLVDFCLCFGCLLRHRIIFSQHFSPHFVFHEINWIYSKQISSQSLGLPIRLISCPVTLKTPTPYSPTPLKVRVAMTVLPSTWPTAIPSLVLLSLCMGHHCFHSAFSFSWDAYGPSSSHCNFGVYKSLLAVIEFAPAWSNSY